jgi:hypothetical protein
LGGAPKAVEQAQKIFVFVFSWAWTSSPITGSNSMGKPQFNIYKSRKHEKTKTRKKRKISCFRD